MNVSVNTIKTEGLCDFVKSVGKSTDKDGKKLAKTELKDPGRAFDNTANAASAVAFRKPNAASSTKPEEKKFYLTGKRLYFGKFVCFNDI